MNPEVMILHKPLEHFDHIFARRVVDLLREFVDLRGIEKPQDTLHLRRPRPVSVVDLVSLVRLRQEVSELFQRLDKNVDNLLDREEFADLAVVAPPLVELFGISSVNDSMMILVALGIP
eukprot:g28009.t1